jgi:hypothetical protein
MVGESATRVSLSMRGEPVILDLAGRPASRVHIKFGRQTCHKVSSMHPRLPVSANIMEICSRVAAYMTY